MQPRTKTIAWCGGHGPAAPGRAHAASRACPVASGNSRHDARLLVIGTVTMVVIQLVMIAIMTTTPVHMRHHGHDLAATGFVWGWAGTWGWSAAPR
jgi:hypothetical protein